MDFLLSLSFSIFLGLYIQITKIRFFPYSGKITRQVNDFELYKEFPINYVLCDIFYFKVSVFEHKTRFPTFLKKKVRKKFC